MGQRRSGIPTEGEYGFMEFLRDNRSPDELEMSLDYTGRTPSLNPLTDSDDDFDLWG